MRRRVPRGVHPVAWWVWALVLAMCCDAITNPLVLALMIAGLGAVAVGRRATAAPNHAYVRSVRLGLLLVAIRVLYGVVFGQRTPGTVLLPLPQLGLPNWFEGISIGGPVTLELVLHSCYAGLRLATILICFGAAAELASPARLQATMPAALYELGVTMAIALSFAPELLEAARELRLARALRGRPTTGLRGARGVVVPVLEGAVARSMTLAGSMEARGFGLARTASARERRWSLLQSCAGVSCTVIACFSLLGGALPELVAIVVLCVGVGCVVVALRGYGRRATRTRYRKDPVGWPEVVVGFAAGVTAAGVALQAHLDPAGIAGPSGLELPVAPPLLVVLLAGFVLLALTPPPPLRSEGRRPTAGRVVHA